MNLQQLAELGGFVSNETVEVPFEWKGNKMVMNVRRLSYGDHEAIGRSSDDKSLGALVISKSLFLPDVARLMTYEEAYQLDSSLMKAMQAALTKAKVYTPPKA